MYISPNKLKWSEARSSCTEYGGQLAEVESEDKMTAIAEAKTSAGFTDALWIGLSDLAKEGTFVWASTGKPAVYTNWLKGEPNGGGNENCGQIWHPSWTGNGNKWNDEPCTRTYNFLCEKP